jgi:hypothetical protein
VFFLSITGFSRYCTAVLRIQHSRQIYGSFIVDEAPTITSQHGERWIDAIEIVLMILKMVATTRKPCHARGGRALLYASYPVTLAPGNQDSR